MTEKQKHDNSYPKILKVFKGPNSHTEYLEYVSGTSYSNSTLVKGECYNQINKEKRKRKQESAMWLGTY